MKPNQNKCQNCNGEGCFLCDDTGFEDLADYQKWYLLALRADMKYLRRFTKWPFCQGEGAIKIYNSARESYKKACHRLGVAAR